MAKDLIKLDFHTHSVASNDGGIKTETYLKILDSGKLNAVAITDHDRIDFALEMTKLRPKQIIVGEEINTLDGEIIGLFLNQVIPPGLSAEETIKLIRAQDGIVYIPHPLEKIRNGLSLDTLNALIDGVDAVELFNSRALKPNNPILAEWAKQHGVPTLAASDSHSKTDLGKTFTLMPEYPTNESFRRLAQISQTVFKRASLRGRFAPTLNRIKKRLS